MISVVQHLKSRHLDIELHKPIVDEHNKIATFLLYNLSGAIVGYQQYRPNGEKTKQNDPKAGRYYTHKTHGTVAVFGVETLHLPGPVFVCEGVFDACRISTNQHAAIAVLSNNPQSDVCNFLHCLGRKIVVIADNDVAGKKLATISKYTEYTTHKDLGESSDEFVQQLLSKHCWHMKNNWVKNKKYILNMVFIVL